MTRRQARRKLGSRSTRRNSTNGKVIGYTANGNRALKRANPKPRSRKNAVNVARLLKGLPIISTSVQLKSSKGA